MPGALCGSNVVRIQYEHKVFLETARASAGSRLRAAPRSKNFRNLFARPTCLPTPSADGFDVVVLQKESRCGSNRRRQGKIAALFVVRAVEMHALLEPIHSLP